MGKWFRQIAGRITPEEYLQRELERTTRSRLEAEAELEAAHWAVKFLKDREIRLRAESKKFTEKGRDE